MARARATVRARTVRGLIFILSLAAAGVPAVSAAQPLDSRLKARLDPAVISEFGGHKAVTRPSRDAVMGFSVSTQVTEVSVLGGQEVTKGTLMIKGDDAEDVSVLELQKLRAEVDHPVQRAQKAMELADVEFKRVKEIYEKGGSSLQEFERTRLTFETAQIDYEYAKVQQSQEVMQVARLQARLDKLRLAAPFDGIVDNVMVDVGQAVNEQEKAIRIVNVDILYMDVPAPTDNTVTLQMQTGDKAWVLLDVATSPRVLEGRVVEVSPTTDLASRTRRIRVEIENPKGPKRVLAGEPAWVRFTAPPDGVISRVNSAATTAPVATGN
jgi:membrane fusion protein (multidrug efflux system)